MNAEQEFYDPPASAQPHPALPPDALIIVPLRNLVLFPGLVAPVHIGREDTIAAVQRATRDDRDVGMVLQRDPDVDAPRPDQLHQIGTMAGILRYVSAQDNEHYIVCQGLQRFRVIEFLDGYPFHAARVQMLPEASEQSTEIQARLMQLRERSMEILGLLPQVPAELAAAAQHITSAASYADFVAGLMDISVQEKQVILETLDLPERLDKVLAELVQRIEVLRLSRHINQQTKERMDERQREFMLREQLNTIRKELGEGEGGPAELADLVEAIAGAGLPPEAEAHARKELRRLEKMSEGAVEYSMLRTYLEWLAELPWAALSEDKIDLPAARRVLDDDHFGLDKVKRRILEYLAVRKLNPHGKSPILCFVGPPGVGKTSLGHSIARATGRKFARVSLGGVHDEAEIRGHRRTYVGALPGNIIQALRKAATRNCVLMLDELDKLGAGFHGDPAAALLEVLDPEQNATFRDNYLALPFDLSKVMFICTANVLDTVPGPLRDRMEVISLPGYTAQEKEQIARRYLLLRQREANGLAPGQCEIGDAALRAIIGDYTREAGVRNLEREIGAVFRHAAMRVAEGSAQQLRIEPADLHALLGPAKFESELAMRTSLPGVATGLAWTPVGGDILFVEASRTPGAGKLILTGQLGEVMKESAQAALTLLKANSAELHIGAERFKKHDIHVHVPAGAIPKDGPSAGVAMFIALASLMTGRPVRSERAMTGEISLRGLVLPVGGIKEKVLAAQRAGIATVLLPARNQKDLEDIPEDTRRQLQFIWLGNVGDAVREALAEPAQHIPGPAIEV
ncbi:MULTISPECIES: endopeptidase La [unclassified Janthinobacterium]|uniref:endopeptidase La n=1 Tax=unclassified Janthinobacterium TaxID=2610881 RepID=UPI0003454856|nr:MULTISPECIES: endopeptidase La [unclassified Janthinobacterium]MEC5162110.1 ATP-dependent Lon protease [Janthinobacterium sp. CG_S6]